MVVYYTSSNFHIFLIQKDFLILGGKVFILIYKITLKITFVKNGVHVSFYQGKNKQVNVGNDFFFFFQHSLPQCIARMWFNKGHLGDFRILPGSGLNQGNRVSADSKFQGPVRILREGVGMEKVQPSCEHRSFFCWLIIFFSEFRIS